MSSTRSDPIVRLAHVVGDFGNPFYAEERQRETAQLVGVGVWVAAFQQLVGEVKRAVIVVQREALAGAREQPVSWSFLHRPS